MNKAPIGLLGGTFDPIHLGHLHIANTLHQSIPLKEIRFIPNYKPALRTQPIATPEQRLAMVKQAIAAYPYFKLDDREFKRDTFSYTYDTLISIRQELPNNAICFIVGIDQFMHFDKWHNWQALINLAHFIVITRPNYLPAFSNDIHHLLRQHQIKDGHLLSEKIAGHILIKDIPPSPISATLIRQYIKTSKDVKELLPLQVWQFIKDHKLYR